MENLGQPRFWSKVVGVIELIMQVLATGLYAFLLLESLKSETFVKESADQSVAIAQYYQFGYWFFVAVILILTVTCAVGIVMAITLLKGAFQRDYNRLNYWMVYAIIAAGIMFLVLLTSGGHVWYVVPRSFGFVVIRGIMVWVVYVDLKDLEGQVQSEDKKKFQQQQRLDQQQQQPQTAVNMAMDTTGV